MSSISSSVFVGVHCYYLYTSVFDWLCLQWTWLSPRSHVRPPLEFVNVLLLIIVFHAFHNKQKKNNKMIAVVFYMYIFLIGLVLVFLSRAVIGATKKNSFRAGFATEVDVVQQLHALQKI